MSELHTIQTILTALNETDERPRSQITAIVRALGIEQSLALLVEANEIEATGGMMLPDGSRRRTPGGVYFALARRRLSPEAREAIFPRSIPGRKDDGKQAPAAEVTARPDRRHVRLISAAEPVRPRPPPSFQHEERASSPVNGAGTTTSVQAAANGTAEVKLVRLDRRRIVPLPPLPPPPEPDPPKRKPRGAGGSSSSRESRKAASQMDLPLPGSAPAREPAAPREPPLPREPAQIRKRVVTLLGPLSTEQKRMMLIDLLAEFSDGSKSSKQAPKKEEPDMRGRILASVGSRLGIHVGQIARTIFGADTPGNRRRVKALASAPATSK